MSQVQNMKLVQSINSAICFGLVLGTQFDKKNLLITNRKSPELSLFTFKSVCKTTLETP